MRVHPREAAVVEAESKIRLAVGDVLYAEAADFTDGETVRILTSVFGDLLATHAKYMIRAERHGDTDRPGGLE